MCKLGWSAGLLACLLAHVGGVVAATDDPEGLLFFERKIRPVLVGECYACHSAGTGKARGGLRLDSKAALLAGGDSGPAVVPGRPDESPLLDALRHEGPAMPPEAKLPGAVADDFAHWIEIGAPDPRVEQPAAARTAIDLQAGRKFWAYQPPRRHEAPAVADAAWPFVEIDRFILAGLEAEGLRPEPDADRATLARRVFFDLIGLPPTPEEIDAFLVDGAPDAYERLVDRLLASPRFGERWGRHWLDVARFGESLTLRGLVLKPAWRYRDYVIDAFNADMPFDRFVREQVAGDLLPSSGIDDRRRQLVATAFLTIGNTNLEEQDKPQLVMDAVDEQVDTIGKAFLGQTIACARCHDHKFDPIPTADYYAIAAILRNTKTLEHANVSKWIEKPLPEPPEREAQIREHERVVADLESRIKAAGGGAAAGKSIVAAAELPGIVVDDAQARKVGEWTDSKFSKRYIASGYAHDGDTGKGEKTLTFQPDFPAAGEYEVRLAYVGGKGRSSDVPVTIQSADGENVVQVDMREAPPIAGRFVSLGKFRFEANGQGYVLISNEGTTGHVVADAVVFLPAGTPESGSPAATGPMEAELKRLRKAGPRRAMALAVEETGQVVETRIHVRGSVHALGAVAPRGFLQVASPAGPPPMMPSHESGRRELAGWLAGPDNPLTARVFVNRAWHWLFGAGLVRTPDNFGTTGEAPSHPDLLDDLAAGFMADGWSTKRLVRRIVLSRTYRQDSAGDPRGREQDPENRRVGRANRRRLDAECLRDAILAVGGVLDLRMGGPSFPADLAADYGFVPTDSRRSVYAPAFRNALPEIFNTFDFADPSLVVGRRDASTVAPQALYLMNHPFVAEESRRAARRLLEQPCLDDSARLIQAYRIAIGRPPTEAERRVSLEFLAGDPDAEASWAMIFRALIASPEFRIID